MLQRLTSIVPSLSTLLSTTASQSNRLTVLANLNSPKINPNFLDHFTKEKTLKALELAEEKSNFLYNLDSSETISITHLHESINSTCDRVFDVYNKRFFTLTTLKLGSLSAWRHLNLTLRHYYRDSGTLNRILYINYSRTINEVKIVSESELATLSDYAHFRQVTGETWTRSELSAMMWQLLYQMNALTELGASCHYIKPEQIFIEQNTKGLKLFDYSGFSVALSRLERSLRIFRRPLNTNAAVLALVKMINPYAPVDNPEEARAYLRTNHHGFVYDLRDIENKVNNFRSGSKGSLKSMISEQIANNMSVDQMFANEDFERFVKRKLKDTVNLKDLKHQDQIWGMIQHSFEEYSEAIDIYESIDNDFLERNDAESEEVTQNLLNMFEAYKAKGDVDNATSIFKRLMDGAKDSQANDEIIARAINEYGKLMSSQGKTEEAKGFYKAAYVKLPASKCSSQRLVYEIKKNYGMIKDNSNPFGAPKPSNLQESLINFAVFCILVYLLVVLSMEDEKQEPSISQKIEQVLKSHKMERGVEWTEEDKKAATTKLMILLHLTLSTVALAALNLR